MMPKQQIPDHLEGVTEEQPPGHSDKLEAIQKLAEEMRDLEFKNQDLKEQQESNNKRIQKIKFETLPEALTEVGMDKVGIPASGNLPACDLVLKPYYKANISADWDVDRRNRAFNWLISEGNGDLIKHTIVIEFGLREEQEARDVAQLLKSENISYTVSMMVPWNTLTSFVKEEIEDHGRIPPLDLLGATIGQIVEFKKRKA